MDIFELSIFVTVAETKSMSKAAQLLYITQSAVSSKMAKLEGELGARLFQRTSRGVKLTAEGQRFYYYALYAVSSIESGKKAIFEPAGGRGDDERLRVGMPRFLMPLILPLFQKHMEGGEDEREWSMMTGTPLDMMLLFQTDLLDLVFTNAAKPTDPNDSRRVLMFEDPIRFFGPAEDNREWKSLSTYAEHSAFILLNQGTLLREKIEKELFGRLRIRPKQIIEVDSVEAIHLLVGQGVGFSFLPSSSLRIANHSQLRLIDCEDVRLKQKFYCIYRVSKAVGLEERIERVIEDVRERIQGRGRSLMC